MNALSYRAAIHVTAMVGGYLSLAMLIPMAADFFDGNRDWQAFAISAIFCGGLSAAVAMATDDLPPLVSRRLCFLLVNLLWFTSSLLGAVPLVLSNSDLSLVQAVFESASAITTTGSTVLTGLDDAPVGLLLWRSMLQWFGGIGIVAVGLFVLPFLRIGGASFFKLESSDRSEKVFSSMMSFIRALLIIYVSITVVCGVTYYALGMTPFDALNHAMTTVATGGFSTHDASFGHFGSFALLWAATIFMTISSLPFSIMILFFVRRKAKALKDPQVILFLAFLGGFSCILGIYHHFRNGTSLGDAMAHSFFNIASILSTSGYASQDYTLWGSFAVALVFFATFLGGCSGSTAGGMKAYRLIIVTRTLAIALKKLLYPSNAQVVMYGDRVVETEDQRTVLVFLATYLAIFVFGSLALSAMGYDILTSTSAVVTALSNVGPGIGAIIGPAGTFASLTEPALALLSVLMIVGRLEVMTVLVVLSPIFWRQ